MGCPLAAAAAECGSPVELQDGWRIDAPASVELDPALICSIGPRLDSSTELNAHAVLVVRHGTLVYERYFAGEDQRWGQPLGRVVHDAGTRHDLRSITKSVISLLVGIAFDRGWIRDLDASVLSLLPQYPDLGTPEKERITLRHLLTMSAGLAWNEDLPYSNPMNSERLMAEAPDPYRYVLEQPVATPPGQDYNYSGGATALLAAILQEASGQQLDLLAQEALFDPLGITDVEWIRYPNGDPIAASGLRLRPRDLAKIGQLLLAQGAWRRQQIVSNAWIGESLTPQIARNESFMYGFQWWLGRSLIDRREIKWVAGFGWGVQRLFLVPQHDLLVVIMAGLYDELELQDELGDMVLNHYVLPALEK